MDEPGNLLHDAVTALNSANRGHDPWTETGGRGGFAWRDADGNQFDITISLVRRAPRTTDERRDRQYSDAWRTVVLGDDLACIGDREGWRFAMSCRDRVAARRRDGGDEQEGHSERG
jgi:hypothetical protein